MMQTPTHLHPPTLTTTSERNGQDLTFGALVQRYLEHLGERSSRERYERIYQKYFAVPEWRDRLASDITRYDVLLLKQSLAGTPAQADKTLAVIKQVYTWAADYIDPISRRPIYEGQNPAWRVNKHDYIPRERVMARSEIKTLLGALEYLCPKYQAFFACRILVPGRIKELCEMRWDAIDATGKWLKRVTKNKRPQYVQIPIQALRYIRALPRSGEFVFPGHYGHSLREGSARKVWERLRIDLQMPDLWLLDFRRTLASYLYNEIKADDLTAKAVLNHYDSRPVAIYTRLNYDKLAEIIQAYADWMWALKPTPLEAEAFTQATHQADAGKWAGRPSPDHH